MIVQGRPSVPAGQPAFSDDDIRPELSTSQASSRWRFRARSRFDSYSCHSPLTSASLRAERSRSVVAQDGGERLAHAHGRHLGGGRLGRKVGHLERLVCGRPACGIEREQSLGDVETGGGQVPATMEISLERFAGYKVREQKTDSAKVWRSCGSITSRGFTSSYQGRSGRPGQVSTRGVPVTLKMTLSWSISS